MVSWLTSGEARRPTPGGSTPRGMTPGSRWRRPVSRWPRCSAPGRVRSCSRAAPPRPSPRPRVGAPSSSGVTMSCAPRSSTRPCATRRRGSAVDVTSWASTRPARVDPDQVLAAVEPTGPRWCTSSGGTTRSAPSSRCAEVVAACRERGVLVHVDAAQAAGHVPIDFDALGADLMSVSAHKLGGPHGTGALLVRRGLRVQPLLVGRRPGAGPAGGDGERAPPSPGSAPPPWRSTRTRSRRRRSSPSARTERLLDAALAGRRRRRLRRPP